MVDGDLVEAGGVGRIRALDGLRGLTALVVVIHHCVEASVVPVVEAESGTGSSGSSIVWWATHSPVHLLLFGPEPVYIFFVLSGLVLSLPLLHRRRVNWTSFWVARMARLYVPAWASLVLAAVLLVAVPRTVQAGRTSWINGGTHSLSWPLVGNDAVFLDGGLNGPLWSLRYEVLFSLLVSLYLMAFVRVRGRLWLKVLLIGAAIMFGAVGGPLHVTVYRTAEFMAMFAVGVLLADHRARIAPCVANLSSRASAVLVTVAVLLLSARAWRLPDPVPLLELATVAGAALVIVIFSAHPTAMRWGEQTAFQWAGRRSFSIYLVHLPLVVAVAELLVRPTWIVLMLTAIPLTLLVAEVFYRLVERPSQKLGRTLGGLTRSRNHGTIRSTTGSPARLTSTDAAAPMSSTGVAEDIGR